MDCDKNQNKNVNDQYMFEVIGKWSELKITNKCCRKIPLFVVNYDDEKVWLVCTEHFKKIEFRKNIQEVIPIEDLSEFYL